MTESTPGPDDAPDEPTGPDPDPVAGPDVSMRPSPARPPAPRWAIGLFALVGLVLAAQVALGWLLWDRTDGLSEELTAASERSDRLADDLAGLEAEVAAVAAGLDDVSVVAGATTGGGLPPYPTSGPDPAVGLTIPTITGTDHYTGEEVTLGVGDTATITMIWAHWCPHCQTEVPMLAELVASGALDEFDAVRFQSVTTFIDDSRPNPLGPYLEQVDLGMPLLVDEDGSIAAGLGMQAVPSWIVTDPDGRVLGRFTGAIGEEALLSVVAEVQGLVGGA